MDPPFSWGFLQPSLSSIAINIVMKEVELMSFYLVL